MHTDCDHILYRKCNKQSSLKFSCSCAFTYHTPFGSLLANLMLSVILLKRKYSLRKYPVFAITIGIIICTIATSDLEKHSGLNYEEAAKHYQEWMIEVLNSHQAESEPNPEGDPHGRYYVLAAFHVNFSKFKESNQSELVRTIERRQPRSLRGLQTALAVVDLVGGAIRLSAEATNLGGSVLSVFQMLSPPQQFGGNADMQYPQDMQLQNLQDMQNTQYSQNMQSQPCTATFSYYASNGSPVYLCECPGGTSYQYLRCVSP